MKRKADFRFCGRRFVLDHSDDGWWITNHYNRRHVMKLAWNTMEHPMGWATNFTVFNWHLTVLKLK